MFSKPSIRKLLASGVILSTSLLFAACGGGTAERGVDDSAAASSAPTSVTMADGQPTAGQAEKEFDLAAFEQLLEETLSPAHSTGSPGSPIITSVDCPDDVDPASGQPFTCLLEAQRGLSGTVTVTLTDQSGQSFSYQAKLEGNGGVVTLNGERSSG